MHTGTSKGRVILWVLPGIFTRDRSGPAKNTRTGPEFSVRVLKKVIIKATSRKHFLVSVEVDQENSKIYVNLVVDYEYEIYFPPKRCV